MTSVCPACAEQVIQPYGDKEGDILFIGSEPTDDEMKYVRPFTGQAFHIFKKELFKRAHIDLSNTRQVSLWYHQKCKKPDCQVVSLEVVEKELKDKKFVVLVGADAVRHFTNLSVDNVQGMDITNVVAEELVSQGQSWFAIGHPNGVFHSLGEFYLGIDRLGKWYQENS